MQALQQLAAAVVALAAVAAAAATDPDADSRLVQKHVAANANATFRPPSGSLRYPYLVPAGPYNEMWDCTPEPPPRPPARPSSLATSRQSKLPRALRNAPSQCSERLALPAALPTSVSSQLHS